MKCLLLVLVGFLAGVVNVLAGGGSFLTVSAMIFMGLPPTVANGTNRIAILFQNVMAVKRFRDFQVLPLGFSVFVTLPAILGSILGAYIGATVHDVVFKKIFAVIMVVVSFLSLANLRFRPLLEEGVLKRVFLIVGFFLVGVYGGFVQAGVGFLILAVLSFCGFDLVVANAVKVFIILVFTVFAIAIFAYHGKVNLLWGLPLAVGNVAGAYVGTGLAFRKGELFIKKVVFFMLVVIALKLLVS